MDARGFSKRMSPVLDIDMEASSVFTRISTKRMKFRRFLEENEIADEIKDNGSWKRLLNGRLMPLVRGVVVPWEWRDQVSASVQLSDAGQSDSYHVWRIVEHFPSARATSWSNKGKRLSRYARVMIRELEGKNGTKRERRKELRNPRGREMGSVPRQA